ncbi:MAG: hypothetical protein NWP79_08090 [Paracoccaceae bacterium]|nr:hypothetical protein [Paracoccaceae bacterium]
MILFVQILKSAPKVLTSDSRQTKSHDINTETTSCGVHVLAGGMHILTVSAEERIQHASLGNGLSVSCIRAASAVPVITIVVGHHATVFQKIAP